MAYFQIDFTADGTNTATLIDSDQWSIPADEHLDILLWNKADVPVDILLRQFNNNMLYSIGQDEYTVEHDRINQRDVDIQNNVALGNTFQITHLAPRSVYPLRVTNLNSTAQRWLDADNCQLSVRGHVTNLYNGERVYIIGHSPQHA